MIEGSLFLIQTSWAFFGPTEFIIYNVLFDISINRPSVHFVEFFPPTREKLLDERREEALEDESFVGSKGKRRCELLNWFSDL